jgi:hypothetical protein
MEMLGGAAYVGSIVLPDGQLQIELDGGAWESIELSNELVMRTSIQMIGPGVFAHQLRIVKELEEGLAAVNLHLGAGDFAGHAFPCALKIDDGGLFENNNTIYQFRLSCNWCMQEIETCARPTSFTSSHSSYAFLFEHSRLLSDDELPSAPPEAHGSHNREWDESPDDHHEMKAFVKNATSRKTCAAAPAGTDDCMKKLHILRTGGGTNASFTSVTVDACQSLPHMFEAIASTFHLVSSAGKLYRLPDCAELLDPLDLCDDDRLMIVHSGEPFIWPPLYAGYLHHVPQLATTLAAESASAPAVESESRATTAAANEATALEEQSPLVLETLSTAPKVFRLKQLLTPAECAQLIARARPRLQGSTTQAPAGSEAKKQGRPAPQMPNRNSHQAWLTMKPGSPDYDVTGKLVERVVRVLRLEGLEASMTDSFPDTHDVPARAGDTRDLPVSPTARKYPTYVRWYIRYDTS